MTISPEIRLDRLAAIVAALRPSAVATLPEDPAATLWITGDTAPERLVLRLDGVQTPSGVVLAAAAVSFGGPVASILRAAPDLVEIPLAGSPDLAALAQVFASEARGLRCGSAATVGRLAEVLLVMALRRLIDRQPPETGLLAGLSHPQLHRALVAIHDAPGAPWTVESLADRAGMSRSRFMVRFAAVMGMPPGAYLTAWRMRCARADLEAGQPVKSVARRFGFASTAAFSRAFHRETGAPPGASRSGAGTLEAARVAG